MHRATERFWRCLDDLPDSIQLIAKRSFRLLKENLRHPSLQFKKVGSFWSVRVGIDHRALGIEDNADINWVWIGRHDEYERIIREGN